MFLFSLNKILNFGSEYINNLMSFVFLIINTLFIVIIQFSKIKLYSKKKKGNNFVKRHRSR